MPSVAHARGTRAALVALAGSSGLVPGQIYVLTDEGGRVAVALTTSTFGAHALEGEGGAGISRTYVGSTAPDPADFDHWYTLTGVQYVWDGAAWFQPVGGASGATSKKPYLWA